MKIQTNFKIAVAAFFLLFIFAQNHTHAQAATWTWMSGSTTVNLLGNYVTPNVFDPANEPPSLYEPVYWRDNAGLLWIYGGYHQSPFKVVFTQMWCYNPYINQWKMVKDFTNSPNYGIKGVAAATNSPGARTFCCPAWVDNNGKFWLFSGMDYSYGDYCDDMWMYDPITGFWTWMHGSNQFASANAVYGVKGVPSPANSPGQRAECYSSWCDANGDFWIFGGQSYSTVASQANFNDMWRFSTTTNEWTWMHGDDFPETPGNFGTIGVSSPTNDPPSRWCYDRSIDPSGNMYIFSGVYALGGIPSIYNEVWKYVPSINEWTWIKGSNIAANGGSYPTSYCSSNASSNPAGRYENKGSTYDECGNIWTFGGVKIGGFFSDAWVYIAAANEWRLLKGNNILNQSAVRGTKGVPNINNHPEGRSGSVAFLDTLQRFYIFGGAVTGNIQGINDVWRLELDPGCVIPTCSSALPVAAFSSSDTLLCEKGSIDFFDNSSGNPTAWSWTFTGGAPATSTMQNPTGIFFANYGTFNVSLTVTNGAGSNTTSFTVTVVANPAQPVVTFNGSTICSSPAVSYQWYFNNAPISNATSQCYTPTLLGNYYVIISDSNGCNSASNIFVANAINNAQTTESSFNLIPNPASAVVQLSFAHAYMGTVNIELYDEKGALALSKKIQKDSFSFNHELELKHLPKGNYIVMIKFGKVVMDKKLSVK